MFLAELYKIWLYFPYEAIFSSLNAVLSYKVALSSKHNTSRTDSTVQTRAGLPPRNCEDCTCKITFGSHVKPCDLILAEPPSHSPFTSTNAGLSFQQNLRILKSCHSFRKEPSGKRVKVHIFVSRKAGKEMGQFLA